MRIAILNPYFDSLGGGEKVTAVMAEHLSHQHDVTILVKQAIDVAWVEAYFNVDLSRVKFMKLRRDPVWIRFIAHPHLRLPGRWRSLLYDYSSLATLRKL